MRLFVGRPARADGFDFGGEPARHRMVAQLFGQRAAFLQCRDGARYVALAEKGSRLAKRAGVALPLFGCIHGKSIRRRNA